MAWSRLVAVEMARGGQIPVYSEVTMDVQGIGYSYYGFPVDWAHL